MENNSKTLSFEFFPPKTEIGKRKLTELTHSLKRYSPEYFSVTFGAGGSTREGTIDTCKSLIVDAKVDACAHISGIGSTKKDIKELLKIYQTIGVTRLVVLRGDLPSGFGRIGDFPYALDLLNFIKAETDEYFRIEIAAYPEVHPEAINPKKDFENFVAKVNAGADGAITQFFYQEEVYLDFINECAKKNINIPIVPGIMPIHDLEANIRMANGCGARIPKDLLNKLEIIENNEDLIKYGIEIVTQLCEKLYSYGAPSIHFYTINKLEPTKAIISALK